MSVEKLVARTWRHPAPVILVLTVASVLALASVGLGAYRALAADGSRDLQWSGIHLLWLGLDPSRAFHACWPDRCDGVFLMSQYPNYPISALMSLLPLGALPWGAAKAVWLVLSLAATVLLYGCARDLAPRLDTRLTIAAFLLLLISTPYRNELGNGQESIFVIAMLAWSLRQARRGEPIRAGLLLALAWFKFTLTLPLSLVFVARRDWRVVGVAAATHIALTFAAAAWTHTNPLAATFGFFAVAAQVVDYQYSFLDVWSIVTHLGLPSAVAGSAALVLATTGLILAWRLGPRDELLLLAVTSLASMAAFYHFSYDCVVFIFPLLYALREIAPSAGIRGGHRLFPAFIFATIAVTWFLNRLIEGNNVGFAFGDKGYVPFYLAMIALFYAALLVGFVQLVRAPGNAAAAVIASRSRA